MKEYDIFFEVPAEVRPHKAVNYTIKVIGGPEEYKQYLKDKEERLFRQKEAKKGAYLIRRALLEDIVLAEKEASPQALASTKQAQEIHEIYQFNKNKMHFKVESKLDQPVSRCGGVCSHGDSDKKAPPKKPTLLERIKTLVFGK